MPVMLKNTEAEADAVARFVELLLLERDMLSGGDIDNLDSLIQRKNAVAAELQALAEQRNTLLADRGFAADRIGVEAWLAVSPLSKTAHQHAWSRVLLLAKEARQLNQLNGELIRVRMHHNSQALETLLAASRQPNLYGSDGHSAPQKSRRINEAA
jgi:flagella synthesis protein FlgN